MADGKVTISTALDTNGLQKGIRNVSGSLGGLKGVLFKLSGAVAAAFAVQKIVRFGAQCIELGSNVAEVQNVVDTAFGSMADKMEAFADTAITTYGMSKLAAKQTGSTYMAMARGMGLAQEAASDMAITLTGLTGDVASFYNISQSEADTKLKSVFTGETESLKSLGVVMTQANLDAFALANGFGKTTSAMTQAELVQLRYSYVMDKLSLASGDFVKTQGSWANQTRILSMQWQEFMSIIGQSLTTILLPCIRALNSLMSTLISMANTINSVVSSIFGGQNKQLSSTAAAVDDVGSAVAGAADAEADLAANTTAAGKAAQKALAGFDELNILQSNNSASSGTSAPVGGTGAGSGLVQETTTEENALSDRMQAFVDKVTRLLQPLKAINFEPLIAAFGRFKEALAPFTKTIFEGLEWAYYNIFVPLAAFTIEDALPAFFDLLAGAIKVLNAVLVALKPLAGWLWENFLKPLAEWTGGIIVSVFEGLAKALNLISDWISQNQGAVQGMAITVAAFCGAWQAITIGEFIINAGGLVGIFGKLTAAIKAATVAKIADKIESLQIIALYAKDFVVSLAQGAAALAANAAAWVTSTAAKVADTAAQWAQIAATAAWNAICALATTVTTAFGAAVAFLTSPIGLVILAIGALIAIGVLLAKNWDTVSAFATNAWESCKQSITQKAAAIQTGISEAWTSISQSTVNAWTNIKQNTSNLWSNVKQSFSEGKQNIYTTWSGLCSNAQGAWNNFKASAQNTASGLMSAVISTFSGRAGGIRDSLSNAFKSALNTVIRLVNNFISWLNSALSFSWSGLSIKGHTIFSGGSVQLANLPQIPYLAQGAVIPPNQEFMAVLGDQTHGTNIEAPLETIKQAVAEELGSQLDAMMAGFEAVVAAIQNKDLSVAIGDDVIYSANNRQASKISMMKGV